MDKPIIKEGIAISIDLCDSTTLFFNDKNSHIYHYYEIMLKFSDLVKFSLNNSTCEIVRYTGDGVLLFYAESIGYSSTIAAIDYAINFINSWKKVTAWFVKFSNLKLRITLDYGKVYTHKDGGLWSGKALNIASKIKNKKDPINDENRVIITENVYKNIGKKNIYKKVFTHTGNFMFNNQNIKTYTIRYEKSQLITTRNFSIESANIYLCISAINTSFQKLKCVLYSLEMQTLRPEKIIIVTSESNAKKCDSSFDISYINAESLSATERSNVRNILIKQVECTEDDYIGFLDGDTLLAPDTLKIAYNVFRSSSKSIISVPRFELDLPLHESEVFYITNMFLDKDIELHLPAKGCSYCDDRATIVDSYPNVTLPSYALFLSKQALNSVECWDENFLSWGEEDIDFTFRLFQNGYNLLSPRIENFISFHLTHSICNDDYNNFFNNAKYLLSKHPTIYKFRRDFYKLIGI